MVELRLGWGFDNNGKLASQGTYILPCIIAGKTCTIEVDIVKSDIPLLLSKKVMKKAKMKIDLENDRCAIFGKEIELSLTQRVQVITVYLYWKKCRQGIILRLTGY